MKNIYYPYKFILPIISLFIILSIGCSETDTTLSAGKLVIYSGRSESLVKPLIEQFATVTGIDVRVKYGKTGAIAATLLEEEGNSPYLFTDEEEKFLRTALTKNTFNDEIINVLG